MREPEYSTVFDLWDLEFGRIVLIGLMLRQEIGGIRVTQFELDVNEGTLVTVVEHYGNESAPRVRVGYKLVLENLRAMTREDDPGSAAGIYLDDLTDPSVPDGLEPIDGVYWIMRPPVAG